MVVWLITKAFHQNTKQSTMTWKAFRKHKSIKERNDTCLSGSVYAANNTWKCCKQFNKAQHGEQQVRNYPKLRSIMSQIQEPCMFVKGAKFPKWGPNFLGNLAPRGPYFLGNLARGGQIFGGAKFPVTPAVLYVSVSAAKDVWICGWKTK